LSFIDVQQLGHVELAGRRELYVLPSARRQIDVPPAVAVADPRETLTVGQPFPLVIHVNPGLIPFGQDRRHLPRACVRQQDEIRVLATIQLLQHKTLGIRRPRESGEIVLARIAGHVQPACFATRRGDHTHAASRVLLSDFGVSERGQAGIQRVGVVDQREFRDAAGVELPVGDPGPVRAPGKAVPQVQFLLVDPIKRAIDDVAIGGGGEGRDLPSHKVFDVQVVLSHVSDVAGGRREFGEHQRCRLRVSAQLAQFMAGAVQQPIIAARVRSPDALRVGEDQHQAVVGRECVVVDGQRSGLARRHEPGGRNQHLGFAGLDVVQHDIAARRRVCGRFQGQVPGAVLRPPRRERLAGKIPIVKNPLDRQQRAIRLLAPQRIRCDKRGDGNTDPVQCETVHARPHRADLSACSPRPPHEIALAHT